MRAIHRLRCRAGASPGVIDIISLLLHLYHQLAFSSKGRIANTFVWGVLMAPRPNVDSFRIAIVVLAPKSTHDVLAGAVDEGSEGRAW
jgi:hypothetical protein